MSNLLDTIINVEIFAFIGVLVWLYLKEPPHDSDDDSATAERPREE